ncbi:MAG TPA: ArsB/NhaD family transporter [Allocoleopsis sp.]
MAFSGAIVLGIAIFLLTLTLVIWRPRKLGIGFTALGGALLTLVTGVVSWQQVPLVLGLVWNAILTVVALLVIALILDEAGFFRWLGLLLAQASVGRSPFLFPLVLLLGTSVSALLSSDVTIFIWMPVVMNILVLLGFTPKAILVFALAIGFIASATSLPLPVSSFVNLSLTEYLDISFLRYFMVMVPIYGIAIAMSLGVLWFYFDRFIPPTYAVSDLPTPYRMIRDPLVCQWSFAILGLLLVGYFLAAWLGLPTSLVGVSGVLILFALAGRWCPTDAIAIVDLRKVLRTVPWQAILFYLGMYFVIFGLLDTGIVTLLSQGLKQLSAWGLTACATGTGFLAMLLSGLTTNVAAGLMNAAAIQDTTGLDPAMREVMVYANAIGCNIGATITPLGSLSTLLWFNSLRRQKLNISWSQYIRIAIALTIPVLFTCLLALAVWLPWLLA